MIVTAENLMDMAEIEKNYDIVIVGLGKTGYACAKYFYRNKISFAVNDSRLNPPLLNDIRRELGDIPLSLGKLDQDLLSSARQILLSPGISLQSPEIKSSIDANVEVIGDIELLCRNTEVPVVAVTGSNGKSTVTTLIGEILTAAGKKAAIGGNIGTPALDLLNNGNSDYFVLELSSFQLETTSSLNAIVSVILNISEDHMDRYPDMMTYVSAKKRIYQGEGTMVINLDDQWTANEPRKRKTITYTLGEPEYDGYGTGIIEDERYLVRGKKKILPVNEMLIHGEHNISNALATLAMAEALNVPLDISVDVLKKFRGLPHRCQLIGEIDAVNWYNDSKATNVGACCAAIRGLGKENNLVLIAGGDGKGANFEPVYEIAKNRVHTAVLLGKDRKKLEMYLSPGIPVYLCDDLESAVSIASEKAKPGDSVLLSPACSSLDMFSDYQARGEAFIRAVKSIKGVRL